MTPKGPFLKQEFFDSLSLSGCIGPERGWIHHELSASEGSEKLYFFLKNHSYGEYIFDWSWAEAYERYAVPYYPKFTSMVPFTPVTTKHFLMDDFSESKAMGLLKNFHEYYENSEAQSAHFLFLHPEEMNCFKESHYLIRESLQYHFFNTGFNDFDSYLGAMKSKKGKNISQERKFPDLTITKYTRDALTQEHARRMYQYYITTIIHKNSYDYLNQKFFELIFEKMKDSILFVEATDSEGPVAGSLFFYDSEKLYGRYWGAMKYIQNLHFELCYYQGIEFCLDKKLHVFEAGAQGEHKIARGFRPVKMYSAHKLKHPAFHQAIKEFIQREKDQLEIIIPELSQGLPFKKT